MMVVGILGASSQVGSSVAWYLKKFPGIRVVCFIRSSYSKVFFELSDIDYQFIDLGNLAELKKQVGQCDIILDFAYPAGQIDEILAWSKENIEKVMSVMKKGSSYFYMSSIMAYGMPAGQKMISNYRLPRSPYAYIKRKVERYATGRGRYFGLKVYNFRLGQVHGFLQSVNTSFRKKLSDTNIALIDGEPHSPVNIIFIYPLCEAIMKCAHGTYAPGLYTVVAYPQWTLKDLYEYYKQYYGLEVHLEFKSSDSGGSSRKPLLQRVLSLAKPYRALLEIYVLMRIPSLMNRIKGQYRRQELLKQENHLLKGMEYIDFNLLGTPSHTMLSGLTTEPGEIQALEKQFESTYCSLIESQYR